MGMHCEEDLLLQKTVICILPFSTKDFIQHEFHALEEVATSVLTNHLIELRIAPMLMHEAMWNKTEQNILVPVFGEADLNWWHINSCVRCTAYFGYLKHHRTRA